MHKVSDIDSAITFVLFLKPAYEKLQQLILDFRQFIISGRVFFAKLSFALSKESVLTRLHKFPRNKSTEV